MPCGLNPYYLVFDVYGYLQLGTVVKIIFNNILLKVGVIGVVVKILYSGIQTEIYCAANLSIFVMALQWCCSKNAIHKLLQPERTVLEKLYWEL